MKAKDEIKPVVQIEVMPGGDIRTRVQCELGGYHTFNAHLDVVEDDFDLKTIVKLAIEEGYKKDIELMRKFTF